MYTGKIKRVAVFIGAAFVFCAGCYYLFGLGITLGRYQLDEPRINKLMQISMLLKQYFDANGSIPVDPAGKVSVDALVGHKVAAAEVFINPARSLIKPDFFSYKGVFASKIVWGDDYVFSQNLTDYWVDGKMIVRENTYGVLDRQYALFIHMNNGKVKFHIEMLEPILK